MSSVQPLHAGGSGLLLKLKPFPDNIEKYVSATICIHDIIPNIHRVVFCPIFG